MSNTARSLTPSQYSLKILRGPDEGAVYPLAGSQISIGRSPENDIVFESDPKVSRRHVIIDLEGPAPKIIDVSGKNLILVDGEQYKEAKIDAGSKIQIGDMEMEFVVHTEYQNPQAPPPVFHSQPQASDAWNLPQPDAGAAPPQNPPPPGTPAWPQTEAPPPKKGMSKRLRFYLIVAAVGGLLWYLLSSEPKKNENPLKIRTSEEIMKDTEASQQRQKAILEAQQKKGTNTRQFDEAQASYVRCFRDYRQGQYTRAIQHCQAALSLYPKHELAERYLSLATRKRDEKIQYLLSQGRLHRERGFYKICMSTLKTVMYDIRDPKNIMFMEARQLYAECRKLSEDRY